MLNAHIFHQNLSITAGIIAADTYGHLECAYSFRTRDWDGLEKWAHFTREGDDTVFDIRLTDDRIRKEDHLDLTEGVWRMYLHGNRFEDGEMVERATTNVVSFTVQPTGVLDGEPFASLSPSLGEQIMARMDEMDELYNEMTGAIKEAGEAAKEAKEAAESAKEAADGIESSVSAAKTSADEAESSANSAEASANNAQSSANEAASSASTAKSNANAAEASASAAAETLDTILSMPTLTLTGIDTDGGEHTWIVYGEVSA